MIRYFIIINLFIFINPIYSQTNIFVDSTLRYQVIDGWEAVSNPLEAPSVRDTLLPYLDTLISIAINDVGITRLRYSLKSGIENSVDYFTAMIEGEISYDEYKLHRYYKINDNSNAFDINTSGFQFSGLKDNLNKLIIPFKKKVEANGDNFYFNLCFVDFKNQSSFHHTSDPEEYAEFMSAAWLFMDSVYKFTPNGIEIILEPDNSDIWNQKHIAPSISATGKRLSNFGYSPEFIAPSLKSIYGIPNFINEIAKNRVALSFLDVISYHRYGGNNDTIAQKKIVDIANQYDKKTSMLEYDYNGDVNELHYDLKYNNVTAWTKYALMYKANEKFAYVFVDATDSLNPKYGICDQTKYLRQYFKYIRPGAQRINVYSSNVDLDPIAFINKSGNQVIVIKAESGDTINIRGLKDDEYSINYTLGNYDWGGVKPTKYDIGLPNQTITNGDILSFYMPSKGVATINGLNNIMISSIDKSNYSNNIRIHPNPASKFVMIDNIGMEKIEYKIISLSGQIILSSSIERNKSTQIDVSMLPIGLYFIQSDSETTKLIIID